MRSKGRTHRTDRRPRATGPHAATLDPAASGGAATRFSREAAAKYACSPAQRRRADNRAWSAPLEEPERRSQPVAVSHDVRPRGLAQGARGAEMARRRTYVRVLARTQRLVVPRRIEPRSTSGVSRTANRSVGEAPVP